MQLNITPRRFHVIVTSIVLLNIFFLAGTSIHHVYGDKIGGILGFILLQLDLAFENVLSAWYSSMLLFLVAIVCILCFTIDSKRFKKKVDSYINFGWIILSLVFATLSLDELGSFHETIGDTSLFEIFGRTEGWEVFYILIMIVGGFMILFSWVRLRRVPLATVFMILGALLLLSNPLQENFEIETMQNSANPLQWRRPVIFLLLEEGSEIFATLCFLVSMLLYYKFATKKAALNDVSFNTTKPVNTSKASLFKQCIFFIVIMAVVMTLIDIYVQREPNNDVGIPGNWFPSIMSFISFCGSFFLFRNESSNKRLFLVMSFFSIALSAYCGSDLYEHSFNEMLSVEKVFNVMIAIFALVIGYFFYRNQKSNLGKACTFVFAFCIAAAFLLPEYVRPELLFVGFSFYLLLLSFDIAE
ncbi:MAG: hypothetical protein ABI683_13065 [Ginsengibacter sp.]